MKRLKTFTEFLNESLYKEFDIKELPDNYTQKKCRDIG